MKFAEMFSRRTVTKSGRKAGEHGCRPSAERLEDRRLLSAVASVLPALSEDARVFVGMAPTQVATFRRLEGIARHFARPTASPMPPKELTPSSNETPTTFPSGPQAATPATIVQTYTGPLTGRIVYLTGGHGLNGNSAATDVWNTDRGVSNGMVEDFGNQDQVLPFADYILRAGGTVAALRPIGNQTNEIVLDNDSASVTFTGTWSDVTTGLHYDEDYGATADSIRFRFASINAASETATATYRPNFTQAGFYPVYTWVTSGTNRSLQTYRVTHSGGVTEVNVDHRNVGRGWVYLGTYHFDTGTNGSVTISNKSASGTIVVADAIRFGNGMGDWNPGTGISGRSREDEAGLYWLLRALGVGGGTGRNVTDYDTGDDGSANVSAQPKFAADMNSAPFGQALYISFHSNAGGGRGAVGLSNADGGVGNTTNQDRLALLLGKEVNEDLRSNNALLEAAWSTRTSYVYDEPTFDYGELSASNTGNEFDATIVEVAFHDSVDDANVLRGMRGRDLIARATAQGVVRYFSEFSATPLQFAPVAPTSARATSNAAGDLTLTWTAPVADAVNASSSVNTGPNGYAATGYDVYLSRNGYGFGLVASGVTGTTYTFPAATIDGNPYYFRIVATNAGGASAPSAVTGARKNGQAGGSSGANRILVVDGFDRQDSSLSPNVSRSISFDPPSTGTPSTYARVWNRLINSFDYVVQAGEAIAAYTDAGASLGFDAAPNEAIISGAVSLSNYQTVIWLSGEESTADETFGTTEQSLVTSYLNAGGRLFVSGSEIGWDLDRTTGPTTADRSFYNSQLKADHVADASNTSTVSGVTGSIFAGLSGLSFGPGTTIYTAEFADVLTPAPGSGALTALSYVGGTGGAAALQWNQPGVFGGARVVNFGFPFETITTAANRAAVMNRVLNFFATAVLPASAAPGVPDLLQNSDSGTSNLDNVTNFNNSSAARQLSISVPNTVAGATVQLFSGATLLASTLATGTTTTLLTAGDLTLADGVATLYAVQRLPNSALSTFSTGLPITVDTVVQPPSAPDLHAGSDTGFSANDDLTNDTTPTFTGTMPEAGIVQLRAFGGIQGSFTSASSWTITSSAVSTGTVSFTATLTDVAGNLSVASPSLSVVINTVAPAAPTYIVAAGEMQRSRVTGLTVTFAEAIALSTAPGAPPFTLTRRSDGLALTPTPTNPSGDQRTFALAFSGPGTETASLADGVWDLTGTPASITNLYGNSPALPPTPVLTFHRLFGDADGDKDVDAQDLQLFTPLYGQTASSAPYFDFDGNGVLSNLDLLQIRRRLGTALVYS